MLAFAAAIYFISPWFRHPHNQTVYFDAEQLRRDGHPEEALVRLSAADPQKDQKYWEQCQDLEREIAGQLAARDQMSSSNDIFGSTSIRK